MKHALLVSVFLLSLSPAFAQNELLSATHHWPLPVEKLLRQTGLALPAGHPLSVQQRQVLRLDSTKNFVFYDPGTPGDSTPVARTIYQYPQPNVEVQLEAVFENGSWMPRSRATLTRDNLQRLLRLTTENFDSLTQTYALTLLLESYPHGNDLSQIDSFSISQINPTSLLLERVGAFHYIYDAQDRLVEEYMTFSYFGFSSESKDVYSYDTQGDNYRVEGYDLIDTVEIATNQIDKTYVDHRLVEEVSSNYVGTDLVPQLQYTYSYTEFGALENSSTAQWNADSSNWALVQNSTTSYDAQERKVREITHSFTIDSETRSRKDYNYVADEFLASIISYEWDFVAQTWVLDDKTYYYYDNVTSTKMPGQPQLPLAMSPNPATGLVQLQLAGASVVQVYSAAGQAWSTRLLLPGEALDLTALPTGMYQVIARLGATVYAGQVVKQ